MHVLWCCPSLGDAVGDASCFAVVTVVSIET